MPDVDSALPPGLPVLREDGPALVVAPAPADFQVAPRVALFPEARPFDQRDGGEVARLDVRLDPVQLQLLEGVAQQEANRLGHVAAARVRPARIITQVGALQVAPRDLR